MPISVAHAARGTIMNNDRPQSSLPSSSSSMAAMANVAPDSVSLAPAPLTTSMPTSVSMSSPASAASSMQTTPLAMAMPPTSVAAVQLQQRPTSSIAHQQAPKQPQQHQQQGTLYSFSVHQPYPNWPLHPHGALPYAPSWYTLPPLTTVGTQVFGSQPKSYREKAAQATSPPSSEDEEDVDLSGEPEGKERRKKRRGCWDAALRTFLERAGLHQALEGFYEDMLVLNSEWERTEVRAALKSLTKELLKDVKLEEKNAEQSHQDDTSLEERKLQYVDGMDSIEVQTPLAVTKSISGFLRQSRMRNDASNRAEFLHSFSEKRRRLNSQGTAAPASSAPVAAETTGGGHAAITDVASTMVFSRAVDDAGGPSDSAEVPAPSCARTDAKPQNRDLQMKYNIARNEDGPLRRTLKRTGPNEPSEGGSNLISISPRRTTEELNSTLLDDILESASDTESNLTVKRHPGLAERLGNIESHLAVRYVPLPPRSLLDRLRFLEHHIIKLERDYPPWAALHFNQPRRGWPPPPRLTPVIVPPHVTSTPSNDAHTSAVRAPTTSSTDCMGSGTNLSTSIGLSAGPKAAALAPKPRPAQSSLQRAVMEKLEIRRAMDDIGA